MRFLDVIRELSATLKPVAAVGPYGGCCDIAWFFPDCVSFNDRRPARFREDMDWGVLWTD